jgi:hypothetical protein
MLPATFLKLILPRWLSGLVFKTENGNGLLQSMEIDCRWSGCSKYEISGTKRLLCKNRGDVEASLLSKDEKPLFPLSLVKMLF